MGPKSLMLTIDVEGDWGGVSTQALREVLPPFLQLLTDYHVSATFFVVAELVDQVRNVLIPEGPHEVGSHGLTHALLTRLSPSEVAFEVTESKRILEAEGYTVEGFRAPYFGRPAALPQLLAQSGYTYDASIGTVYPCPPSRQQEALQWHPDTGMPQLATSTLRDGWTPFSLTYLRLYSPFGLPLVSPRASLFYCHLHEFLDASEGWQQLPAPLRYLHQRNSGKMAWHILERLLQRYGDRFVSCRQYLDVQSCNENVQV